jgi:hypothetical protein
MRKTGTRNCFLHAGVYHISVQSADNSSVKWWNSSELEGRFRFGEGFAGLEVLFGGDMIGF